MRSTRSDAQPPDDQAVIQTTDLTRRFRRTLAVDGLNLRVARGEILGLVGPDGAGKTTTLRLLAALMNPTHGHASVLGYDTVRRSAAIKQRLGYMAQRFSLYGDLSVAENLSFYADIYGVRGDERRQRLERLLAFARLGEFRTRRAAQLSGGMQKKLALACTLIHTPQIILLDEPTTGVDPVSRREFWDILAELHVQGVTLVICTPYMDEAERCSRVGLMYRGRMIVCDTPERVRALTEGELVAVWPSDVRRARAVVAGLPGVAELQTFGDQLRVFTPSAQELMPRVQAALEAAGVGVLEMRPTQPRMEEAFISLIRRQRALE
jgi:ABC-2 type transport system ATP-binding protein